TGADFISSYSHTYILSLGMGKASDVLLLRRAEEERTLALSFLQSPTCPHRWRRNNWPTTGRNGRSTASHQGRYRTTNSPRVARNRGRNSRCRGARALPGQSGAHWGRESTRP